MNNDPELFAEFNQSPQHNRSRALLEIFFASGIVSGLLAQIILPAISGKSIKQLTETNETVFNAHVLSVSMLLDAGITFVILWIMLKMRGETFSVLGLRRTRWKSDFFAGLVLAPALLLVNGVIGLFFQIFLPEHALDRNPLTEAIHSPEELVLFIIVVVIAGGIREEVQRAFIFRRFCDGLGGEGVGLILWSLGFGALHYVQGFQGVVVATVLGFIFGVFYLMRRSLVGPITMHAAYNTLVLLLYWFVFSNHAD